MAVETSSEKSTVSYHLHAFLEFNHKLLISDVRDYLDVLRDILFSNHLDVQPCRSKRNALKYISKEDKHLYFNCKVSDLNFYYRCFDWCRHAPIYRRTDPFVVQHRFCSRFVTDFFYEKYHGQTPTTSCW